jgi:hypothetical protein
VWVFSKLVHVDYEEGLRQFTFSPVGEVMLPWISGHFIEIILALTGTSFMVLGLTGVALNWTLLLLPAHFLLTVLVGKAVRPLLHFVYEGWAVLLLLDWGFRLREIVMVVQRYRRNRASTGLLGSAGGATMMTTSANEQNDDAGNVSVWTVCSSIVPPSSSSSSSSTRTSSGASVSTSTSTPARSLSMRWLRVKVAAALIMWLYFAVWVSANNEPRSFFLSAPQVLPPRLCSSNAPKRPFSESFAEFVKFQNELVHSSRNLDNKRFVVFNAVGLGSGLGNQLQGLLSTFLLAMVTGRGFLVNWRPHSMLNARIEDLFDVRSSCNE